MGIVLETLLNAKGQKLSFNKTKKKNTRGNGDGSDAEDGSVIGGAARKKSADRNKSAGVDKDRVSTGGSGVGASSNGLKGMMTTGSGGGGSSIKGSSMSTSNDDD